MAWQAHNNERMNTVEIFFRHMIVFFFNIPGAIGFGMPDSNLVMSCFLPQDTSHITYDTEFSLQSQITRIDYADFL